jgi:hypothetical protein
MTPKEKADKLFMRLLIETTTDIPYGVNKIIAKECALIAVDEIINIACDVSDYDKSVTKSYWIEIKQEIEAL